MSRPLTGIRPGHVYKKEEREAIGFSLPLVLILPEAYSFTFFTSKGMG